MSESNAEQYANHVPAGVRRAAQRAEDAARALGAANVPADPKAPAVQAPAPIDPPLTPEPAAAAPAAPAAPTPAPAPTPPPATDGWEQRYRTLQGKYDAEVPPLRRQIDQLQGQLEGMQRLLTQMQSAPPQRTEAPAPAASTTVVIPKEDVETFGEDLINAARRWASAELGAEIKSLKEQVAQLHTGQRNVQAQTATDRVLAYLDNDRELSDTWRKVNEDTAFLAWLDQVDPFSGSPRKLLLGNAFNNGDAPRVARFFKGFIAEHTAVSQAPAPAPHTPPGAGRPTLEELAAPGRPAPPPVGAPAAKRVWTNSEITAFYRDRTHGRYAGREADAQRLEQDIVAAAAEGRIR